MKLNDNCVTYNCNGKLIEYTKLSLECSECHRTHWNEDAVSLDGEQK